MTAQCLAPEGALDLGQLAAEATAKLAAMAPKLPLGFQFAWQGIAFSARIHTGPPPRLRLIGDLGPLPYSAEDVARRRAAFGLPTLRSAPRFWTTAANRLTIGVEQVVAEPKDPLALITAVTLVLLGLKAPLEAAQPLLARIRAPTAVAA